MTTRNGWVEMRMMSVDADVEAARRDLARDVERLLETLGRAATALAAGGTVDPLGVVRDLGLTIDRQCAVLAYAQKEREAWRSFATQATESESA